MAQPPFSVCVFCGSRMGEDPAFAETAEALGRALAEAGQRLVYGAGDVGLMGVVARAAMAAGGETMGVIPAHLMGREMANGALTQLVVTENMHERKKVMYMNSDAIVVMPGGAGSLDEFFEVLTWRQLALHGKPIFLLDVNGYWDPLSGLLTHVVERGFADASLLSFVETVPDVPAVMAALQGKSV
ncbi:MAG: TIGR00730 family Rossman fold protein [Pseudomonadota bacterium]